MIRGKCSRFPLTQTIGGVRISAGPFTEEAPEMTEPANGASHLPNPNPFVGTWRLVSIESSESRLLAKLRSEC